MGEKYVTIYISSKMSGIKNFNRDAFDYTQANLESLHPNWKVWNPAQHELKGLRTWAECLADDIISLQENCDGIYMFGQWYRSQGAIVELLSMHRLKKMIFIEQWWLRWIPKALDILTRINNIKGITNEDEQ